MKLSWLHARPTGWPACAGHDMFVLDVGPLVPIKPAHWCASMKLSWLHARPTGWPACAGHDMFVLDVGPFFPIKSGHGCASMKLSSLHAGPTGWPACAGHDMFVTKGPTSKTCDAHALGGLRSFSSSFRKSSSISSGIGSLVTPPQSRSSSWPICRCLSCADFTPFSGLRSSFCPKKRPGYPARRKPSASRREDHALSGLRLALQHVAFALGRDQLKIGVHGDGVA